MLAEAEEAGEPFTDTVAAYNVDVVNYLLSQGHPGAADVIRRLVTIRDEDTETFLRAYLNLGAQREALVAGLVAAGWRDAFEYLTAVATSPSTRARLSSALRSRPLSTPLTTNSRRP